MEPQWEEELQNYIRELQRTNVRLRDRLDVVVWVHAPIGKYSPKFGYNYLMVKRA